MSITTEDILGCANLSRLALDEQTAQSYAGNLDKILAMMDVLDSVNTDHIKPLANIHEACTDLRADVPNPDIDREAYQAIAPKAQDGLYLVPQVIE
ncbi:Asp-tRNA(Asn)/Glu-tRNA(Gln) amidotransferase subunit GatC [Moraxella canis]|uniref:Aspartyl/glutamyl-tRNA(Asn/Gln) amidotransferase subunit C n=1 Tax=Moraxella canis TaxID=90239 RepID=A0A1S9ZHC9_9GAMM|nr:Asp-tRNA(Asn)/Glu-tRNA(Gln) amidotransferase subunit GatC [Moraxella canis]OOR82915.1 asparaginyl/glutamyl-tRNA amidotransferase subunit C [Moraxella canis]WQE04642.1 Asp-tRNA(Asn)/Glu-tRNA(Gln) amidotransferase subunit GatC [Moraxella canis]